MTALMLMTGFLFALPPNTVDATLTDTAGHAVRISELRGKPVVLFYEDRDGASLNTAFKEELGRRAERLGLKDAAHLVPVANLGKWNFFPARGFALDAVRGVERKTGTRLLVDWSFRLERSLGLPKGTSATVAILDERGELRFQHSGALSAQDQSAFFEVLGDLLNVRASN